MAISFSGLGSGLDTSSWVDAFVSVKQQDITKFQKQLTKSQSTKAALTTTRSAVSNLRSAIEKLTDAKFGGVFDLFGKSNAVSSNDEVFTATVGTNARRQSYDINVKQLATYTKATSRNSASSVADDSTSLKSLGITKGTLTAYVNGVKNTFSIGESDTIGDLKTVLADAGIALNVEEDGVMTFSAVNPEDTIHIGTTTDTSNLVSLVGLERQEDGSYASTNSVYKATTATKLTSEDSGFNQTITAGTFTIGNAEFNINGETTLSSLISAINENEDAQAYAFWDDATGKLSITSTKEGASFINIEAGTSNFTDVMGLTESEWDEDGNLVSTKMYTDAQELGQNAIFSVNGTVMTSTSNTVTEDVTRMEGVTLNLKRANTEDDGKTTLNVTQDTSGLKEAINSFVTAYNDMFSQIDKVTANGAELHGESSLTSLKNTIRSYANGSNDMNGGVYKLLSEIGISTAQADSNNLSADTNALAFDEEKFIKALEENPESVKALLSGENGIFSMMEDTVEQSLKAASGFFDIKTSTLDADIKKTEEKITKKNKSIATYKAQLEKKFQAMENMIAQMQQNYSKFTGGIAS